MFSTAVIAVAGVLLLIGTIVPGVRLWWPQHRDPVSRSDLGVALMTGALIAFAVLAVQVLIQIRSQRDANAREDQANRAALLLQLGRSRNLSGLDLQDKNLSTAYLNKKNLSGANLEEASMTNASLQSSKLIGANLKGATLDGALLDGADLRHADLGGASLVRAKLIGANLDEAALSPDVDLSHANLSNAYARADLRHADLSDANLVGARLAPANLEGADLSGADLQFADLRGANLKGANLYYAVNLDRAKDLSLAMFDDRTRWPPKFVWPPLTGKFPSCLIPTCTLLRKGSAVHDFPPELTAMRERLAGAAESSKCLPGWTVVDRPLKVEAFVPGHRASFHMQTASTEGMTPSQWAQSFKPENAEHIPAITADGPAYALRFMHVERGLRQEEVHVWFVRGQRGFHLWGSASPALFSMYERDFIRLFGAMGVEGNLFPSLRGDKDPCGTQ
jgi:uncharacterized protein YjbI with pentapeptide repeats